MDIWQLDILMNEHVTPPELDIHTGVFYKHIIPAGFRVAFDCVATVFEDGHRLVQ